MGVPSSQDQEALDALFRKARAEPSAEHLHRVKQRLHALAVEGETPRGHSGSGAVVACLAVIGCSLLLGPRESVVVHGAAPSGRTSAAIASESPMVPEVPEVPDMPVVVDAVPVEALALAREEPRADPARVVPAERDGALRDRRPARGGVEPARAVVAKQAVDVESSRMVVPSAENEAESAPPPVAEVARAEGEASFLRRAKVALATDPAQALRLTDEHPVRYPRGVLLQEREVIAIEALIRLGRASDARARAASFRSRYPMSAHHGHLDDQIERLLGGSTNDARADVRR